MIVGFAPAKVGQHQTIPTQQRPASNDVGRFCYVHLFSPDHHQDEVAL